MPRTFQTMPDVGHWDKSYSSYSGNKPSSYGVTIQYRGKSGEEAGNEVRYSASATTDGKQYHLNAYWPGGSEDLGYFPTLTSMRNAALNHLGKLKRGNPGRGGGGRGWSAYRKTHHFVYKKNPGLADEISEGFHGRKVSERFEVEEEELYPDNLAVLGCLVELKVNGILIRGFKNPYSPGYRKGDEVYLAAADRNNLEFVGGDQEIVNASTIAKHTNGKRFLKLGKVESIVYLADKHHLVGSNGKEEEYEHDFGKKKYFLWGKKVGQPELVYDCLNKTMRLVGGSYTITDEGIKD